MKQEIGRKILMVVDAEGRIVGTCPPNAPSKGDGAHTTLAALPGQTVHEVALPKELEALLEGPAEKLHQALSECQLRPGPAMSVLVPRQKAK